MAYGKTSRDTVESAPVGGSDFWNPPTGESRVRIMPPWSEDAEQFWFVTATHFNVGPDERPVPCPVASGVRETCYICRTVKRLERGDGDEKSEAEQMGPRPRYLLNIVDMDKPQDGVQVWPAPKTVFRKLKKFWLMEADYGDFTSFTDGFTIIITKEGSGLNTEYDAIPAPKTSRFPPDSLLNHRSAAVAELYQSIADEEYELPDLSQVQNFISDEEMERVYKGLSGGRARTEKADDNGDGEEPEAKPRARRNGRDEPATTRAPRSALAEEPEEPVAREARPARTTRPAAAAREEPEAEEPEETPRAKKPRPDTREDADAPKSRIRGSVRELD